MKTIAVTGQGGGKLASLCDVLLDVPSLSTPLIQQAHICLYHFIYEKVELKVVESGKGLIDQSGELAFAIPANATLVTYTNG